MSMVSTASARATAQDLVAADQVTPQALHGAFAASFADYLAGPFELPLAQWDSFVARQAADLALSRVALRDGGIVALALVAPRPARRCWRVATMGATPAARGTGLAPALLDDLLARAAAAGMDAVELEVFAANTRAVRLYEGRGFQAVDELHGHSLDAGTPRDSCRAVHDAHALAVPRDDALAWLDDAAPTTPPLPLQVTAQVLARLVTPWRAWRLGDAQLVAGGDERLLRVHSFVHSPGAEADADALLASLRAGAPDARLEVPPLQRQAVGGAALDRAGAMRQPLHQLWMRCALAG